MKTVKELIAELETLDQDAVVVVRNYHGHAFFEKAQECVIRHPDLLAEHGLSPIPYSTIDTRILPEPDLRVNAVYLKGIPDA